eukprot:16451403-Heterocapsa_arctica.AAC.1
MHKQSNTTPTTTTSQWRSFDCLCFPSASLRSPRCLPTELPRSRRIVISSSSSSSNSGGGGGGGSSSSSSSSSS